MRTGTSISDAEYKALMSAPESHCMTDAEAALFIGKECGFDPLKVEFIRETTYYFIDDCCCKGTECKLPRDPIYQNPYANYIKFYVSGYSYEYVNGELQMLPFSL